MTRRYISPAEAAEYLALKVKTVYSLAARGLLPCVRFGRQLRIDLRRLDELAEAEIQFNTKNAVCLRESGQRSSPGDPASRVGRNNGDKNEYHGRT